MSCHPWWAWTSQSGSATGSASGQSGALLDLVAQPVDALGFEQVLETGTRTVVAVAVVALGGHDRLDDVDDIARRYPRDGLRQQGIGVVGTAVAHAHPAAREHDEAGEFAGRPLRQRRHDPDVVGVDVDAVVAGPGDRDLELPGQVGSAVDRLDVVDRCGGVGSLGRHGTLAVDPQLPVALGLRAEPGDDRREQRIEDRRAFRMGERARHHVAHHVAAGAERGQQ